jgi:hypothetical protein
MVWVELGCKTFGGIPRLMQGNFKFFFAPYPAFPLSPLHRDIRLGGKEIRGKSPTKNLGLFKLI